MKVGFGANLCGKAGGRPRNASMEGERHEVMGGNAPRRHQQQATARGELGEAPGDQGQLLLSGKGMGSAVARSVLSRDVKPGGGLAEGLGGAMGALCSLGRPWLWPRERERQRQPNGYSL